jgi:hypothetical protein
VTYRYVFDGADDETFPEPPIARTLSPGDEVETETPVDHPRLRLIGGPTLGEFRGGGEGAEPDTTMVATPDLAPVVAPDAVSTPAEAPPA